MKNRITILLLSLVCVMGVAGASKTVYADTLEGDPNWKVTFTSDKKMDSNFSSGNMNDTLDLLQPGDDASFKVTIANTYGNDTDWYMRNEVIESLEDASKTAAGGAYSYRLAYVNPDGVEQVLYDSESVGGVDYTTGKQGLHEATDALDEFFYLDTLSSGKTGYVTLKVLLDGETQTNNYQDTLAKLQLNFAVELPTDGQGEERQGREVIKYVDRNRNLTDNDVVRRQTTTVKTGDETRLGLLYIIATILGLLCVFTGVMGVRARRKGGVR